MNAQFLLAFSCIGGSGAVTARAGLPIASTQVFVHGESPYRCIRIPSLVASHKKDVLLAFSEGRYWTGDGCAPDGRGWNGTGPGGWNRTDDRTDLVFKRSTDAGRSWGPLGVVASAMGNANAAVLASGEISVLAMGHPAYTTPNYQIRSTDDGLSWSKPAIVGPLSNSHGNRTVVANGPGTFIQLSANHSHAPNRLLSTGYTYDVSNPGESGEQIPYYRFAPATTTFPKNKMLYTLRVQRRGFQVAESVHHRLGRYWPAKRRPLP